jgi:asparagine synthetase B (glutamine-hydrolysing)
MCGFLVHHGGGDNSRIRLRGPDSTHTLGVGGLTFVHNLLAVTGEPTPQPFVVGDIVCVYNGQIYNHRYARSDGEVLIPLYQEYGDRFAQQLDGEFAIALYDFSRRRAIFATDPFKSKPLFVNGLECASYRSGVGGDKANPNEIVVKDFDGSIVDRARVREWDWTQSKTQYDDWIAAFDAAVAKRAKPGCFLGLSSGYDSGAIACALLDRKVPFKAFIYAGSESPAVIAARCDRVPHERFSPDAALCSWLRQHVDDEPYTIVSDGVPTTMRVLDDGATLGVATIARLGAAEGRKVALSGQGADEIISDYAPWPGQSELKGRYPETLRPWANFNFSCQESYLIKEEYAAGAFGIENRYPFLDAQLVQEFLWLSAELKNRHYKAPLREYLRRHDFPFEEGVKRGFAVS